jgi:Chitin synthase export chaperone
LWLIASLGRLELIAFLILYFLTLVFQLVSTGSFLEQDSKPLVIVTAIHAGMVVALFWSLLANAIVATQVVDDGSKRALIVCFQLHITMSSKKFVYQPLCVIVAVAFGVTVYISLDIGLGITQLIGGVSTPPEALRSIALFILTSIWPLL